MRADLLQNNRKIYSHKRNCLIPFFLFEFKQNVRRALIRSSQYIRSGDKTEGDIHFD